MSNIISDIYFSRAFRRLGGKTQLFSNYNNDHYHNRLTHTLEVLKIAEEINSKIEKPANGFILEASALAHDLGHTPFGHAGERALNEITYQVDTLDKTINPDFTNKIIFKHNYYSAKVLLGIYREQERIDKILIAIVNHTKLDYTQYILSDDEKKTTLSFYLTNYSRRQSILNKMKDSFIEAQIIAMADEIAQRISDLHDIMLSKAKIINCDKFTEFLPKEEAEKILGYPNSFRVKDLLSVLKDFLLSGISYDLKTNSLIMGKDQKHTMDYIDKMRDEVIKNVSVISEFDKHSTEVIKYLFKSFYKNPKLLDEKTISNTYKRIISIYNSFDEKVVINKQFQPKIDYTSIDEKISYLTSISDFCINSIDKKLDLNKIDEHFLKDINSELAYSIIYYIANMTDRFANEKYSELKRKLES